MNNAYRIDANIKWYVRKGESHRFVADCEELNLCIDADSYKELFGSINEGLTQMFRDMLLNNTLDSYLHQHGWVKHQIPKPTLEPAPYFDVPFELLMSGNDRTNHIH